MGGLFLLSFPFSSPLYLRQSLSHYASCVFLLYPLKILMGGLFLISFSSSLYLKQSLSHYASCVFCLYPLEILMGALLLISFSFSSSLNLKQSLGRH